MRIIEITISECQCGCKQMEGGFMSYFTGEKENPRETEFATRIARLVAEFVAKNQPQCAIEGVNPRGDDVVADLKHQPKHN